MAPDPVFSVFHFETDLGFPLLPLGFLAFLYRQWGVLFSGFALIFYEDGPRSAQSFFDPRFLAPSPAQSSQEPSPHKPLRAVRGIRGPFYT